MTLRVECRPLSNYPAQETRNRVRAPFHRKVRRDSGYHTNERILLSDTLDLLGREVRMIGCTHLVIEADFRENQIRQDGWPKADARPSSPRVVISLLKSKHGPLRYPCDTFDRFEDNVRAVALALEALRMVDRYGVTRRGEQYAGWKAIPAQTGTTMTAEAAAALVAGLADYPERAAELLRNAELLRAMLRSAVKRAHPDTGGTGELFHQVQTARQVLGAHLGVTL